MYDYLERHLKCTSKFFKYGNYLKIWIMVCIGLIAGLFAAYTKLKNEYIILSILLMPLLFYIVIMSFIMLFLYRYDKQFMLENFKNNIIEPFNELLFSFDKRELERLCVFLNIYDYVHVNEILNHYRQLLPRKINHNFAIIPIITLAISILGIIFNENLKIDDALLIIFLLISVISVFIIALNYAARRFSVYLGKDTFSFRIEKLFSELMLELLSNNLCLNAPDDCASKT